MGPIFGGVVLLLLAALAGYFAAMVFSETRRSIIARRSAELEREYLRTKIDQIMEQKRLDREKNELSWNGYRKFRIAKKVLEGGDICSFYLSPHDGKPLPPFQPGQYLTFQLNITDGPGKASKPVIRCYSLSDSPFHPDYYRVSIKKIPPPRDKPGILPGVVSNFFHEKLNEGDIVDVKAPGGKFTLDLTRQTPVVLIGGGVGLTPVLSMMNAIVESDSKRETWFFYGVRNSKEHVMKDHLERLAREHENLHIQVCYSDPVPTEVKGRDYQQAERVSADLFKRVLPSSNYEFYICGPPPMMNSLTADLKAWGVPEDKIFFEAFGPATVKKLAPAGPAPAAAETAVESAMEVVFAKSGKTCRWQKNVGSILEFAEANGIALDFGCRAGNCGTCLTAVKSGEVTYMVETGHKPEAGSCLACVTVPKSNLVLDA
jgi:ferredoxin-NADP reductase